MHAVTVSVVAHIPHSTHFGASVLLLALLVWRPHTSSREECTPPQTSCTTPEPAVFPQLNSHWPAKAQALHFMPHETRLHVYATTHPYGRAECGSG